MGAKVCFHFELDESWYGRPRDLQLWRWLFHSLGVESAACIAPMDQWYDIQKGWETPPYSDGTQLPYLFHNLNSFLEKESGPFVFTDAYNGFPVDIRPDLLPTYQHPESIWYVFGPNSGLNPNRAQKRDWLCIPQIGEGRVSCFHALNAASIILYDRAAKGGTKLPQYFTEPSVSATVPSIE